MLSAFYKKLLFARQFFMIDGKIEILNEKQVMLPLNVVLVLENSLSNKSYESLKKTLRDYTRDFTGRLGIFEAEMLDALSQIYESCGLGKMEVMNMDIANKKAVVCVNSNPLIQKSDKGSTVTSAIVAGMFSALFKKEVDCTVNQVDIRTGYCEFMVK